MARALQMDTIGDERLQAAVQDALWRYDPIRISESIVGVEVRDGVVELVGHVRSDIMRIMAEELVRQVQGVRQVHNRLLSDTTIESAVSVALAGDGRTRQATDRIFVKSVAGTVILHGRVVSEDTKQAIAEAVKQVEGVRQVANRLEIDPALAERLKQKRAGEETPEAAVEAEVAEARERAAAEGERPVSPKGKAAPGLSPEAQERLRRLRERLG